jgi:hypothetical protein
MNFLKTAALCTAFVSTIATAGLPPKPAHCPEASELQNAQLIFAVEKLGQYITVGQGNYGTEENWAFAVANVHANGPDEALEKANNAIKSLTGSPSPMPVPMADVWACIYQLDNGYVPVAITPLPSMGNIQGIVGNLK